MNVAALKEVLLERERICRETYDEWDDGIERCRELMLALIAADPEGAKRWLEDECTAADFAWLAEIFPELMERLSDRELLTSIQRTAQKFSDHRDAAYIKSSIEEAESILDDKEEGH